ncbi:MAG: hypothetical protein ACTHJ9_14015 [Rhodanobacter sp.]
MTTFSKGWGRAEGTITLSHIYPDGWSVAVSKDGRLHNRWEERRDEFPERWEATQEWINAQNAKRMSDSGLAA